MQDVLWVGHASYDITMALASHPEPDGCRSVVNFKGDRPWLEAEAVLLSTYCAHVVITQGEAGLIWRLHGDQGDLPDRVTLESLLDRSYA